MSSANALVFLGAPHRIEAIAAHSEEISTSSGSIVRL